MIKHIKRVVKIHVFDHHTRTWVTFWRFEWIKREMGQRETISVIKSHKRCQKTAKIMFIRW